MILEQIKVGPMQVNCYILGDAQTRRAIVIDPGDDYDRIRRIMTLKNLKGDFIINTHGHIDHIGADDKFGLKVYAHKDEIPMLKDEGTNLSGFLLAPFTVKSDIYPLEDNQDIRLDSIHLKVMHTPGHTPGGISLLLLYPKHKIVFTGDTLFCQGIGRTDFPGASEELIIKSIKARLLTLPDDTVVYPGHGPSTTIGAEKKGNPFL
jgi:hydroxyacylglutathione hydrolase